MCMFDVSRVSAEVGGEEISFETGKLARQASGAVVVRSGDTMVLATTTVGNLRDVDFLPLTSATTRQERSPAPSFGARGAPARRRR
jgi:polyribonucleotide nucleotidyltransferase